MRVCAYAGAHVHVLSCVILNVYVRVCEYVCAHVYGGGSCAVRLPCMCVHVAWWVIDVEAYNMI